MQEMRRMVVERRDGKAGSVRMATGPVDVAQLRAHTADKMNDEICRWFHAATPVVVGSCAILFDSAVHHFAKNQLLPCSY
jgi:hypothetical protein